MPPRTRTPESETQPELPVGAYIAAEALYVGAVRAHNPGDLVPFGNITRNGWADKIRRIDETEAGDG